MRRRPRGLVLFGNGINCEVETAYAQRKVGFAVDLVHINTFSEEPHRVFRYDMLTLPGGFLDGDDLGAAKAQAMRWKYKRVSFHGKTIVEVLLEFVSKGGLLLGICNGFQLLVKTALLPCYRGTSGRQVVSLTFNDSGKFEDRWVFLKVNQHSPCIFTRGLDLICLPCRHGEGKFITTDPFLVTLQRKEQIVVQYSDSFGNVTDEYPLNPNGSILGIAGICDETGRIFGLMPHPEVCVEFVQHPLWTRLKERRMDGIRIFENAYRYAKENL
jgi:phosphoribosylformylglycinamidine synthase